MLTDAVEERRCYSAHMGTFINTNSWSSTHHQQMTCMFIIKQFMAKNSKRII